MGITLDKLQQWDNVTNEEKRILRDNSKAFGKWYARCFNGSLDHTCTLTKRMRQLVERKRKRSAVPINSSSLFLYPTTYNVLTSSQFWGSHHSNYPEMEGSSSTENNSTLDDHLTHDANLGKTLAQLAIPTILSFLAFLLICGVLLRIIRKQRSLLVRSARTEFRMRGFETSNGAAVAVPSHPGVTFALPESMQNGCMNSEENYHRQSADLKSKGTLKSTLNNLIHPFHLPLSGVKDCKEDDRDMLKANEMVGMDGRILRMMAFGAISPCGGDRTVGNGKMDDYDDAARAENGKGDGADALFPDGFLLMEQKRLGGMPSV